MEKSNAGTTEKVLGKAAAEAKAAADAIGQTHLDQAAATKRLMEKAAADQVAKNEAAAKLQAENDARAEEETQRVIAEADAARIKAQQDAEAQAAEDAKNKIAVTVPKAYKLNIDNHNVINYPAGTYAMPKKHAEHWWSKANGVVPFDAVVDSVKKSTSNDTDAVNAVNAAADKAAADKAAADKAGAHGGKKK